jgi:hypothetical protein
MHALNTIASRMFDRLFLSQIALCDDDFDIFANGAVPAVQYHPTDDEVDTSGPIAYSYFGA